MFSLDTYLPVAIVLQQHDDPVNFVCRNRGDLDEDEDAYLVPSDWEDDGDDEDWGGGTAGKRAKEREKNLIEVCDIGSDARCAALPVVEHVRAGLVYL